MFVLSVLFLPTKSRTQTLTNEKILIIPPSIMFQKCLCELQFNKIDLVKEFSQKNF
jgi:hypothetical protein